MAAPFAPDPFIPRSLLPATARWLETFGGGFALLLGSSLAASLGALPFEIAHFHFVSLVGPLANLLVVPLAELIVTVGTLSLGFGSLCSFLGALLNNANWLFARALLATVSIASHLPATGIAVGDPGNFLSGSPGLRLLFPAVPPGSACFVRWEGKVFLVQGRAPNLTRIEPIRRFYGWNWLDATIRRAGESWEIARRTPWGVASALTPFSPFSATKTLRLETISSPLPSREPADVRSALLIEGKRLTPLTLFLASSFSGEILQEKMDLVVDLGSAGPSGGKERLWLSLEPCGSWLQELGPRDRAGRAHRLGKSAVEVVLTPDRIEFRPYRRHPVSFAVGLDQAEEGAASQIPSSPPGSVQQESGSNPFSRRSRTTPSGVNR